MVLRSGTRVDPSLDGEALMGKLQAVSAEEEDAEDEVEGEEEKTTLVTTAEGGETDLLSDDEDDEDFVFGDDAGDEDVAEEEEASVVDETDVKATQTDDEWEDVESDGAASADEEDASELADEQPEEVWNETTSQDQPIPEQEDQIPVEEEAPKAVDSPLSDHESVSPQKVVVRSPRKSSPKKVAQEASPVKPAPKEERYRPRISDTAVLHDFLNRTAAKEKPSIKRRESLTNRRDSDTIRQALASPTKTEVLAELDANSPSPHKALRNEASKLESSKPENLDFHKSKTEDDEHRPTRRSSRSRARPSLLLEQTAVPTKAEPNKITIRGPMDAPPLKRSEVQELAAATRNNTRKNKGQAIMPLDRLSALAADVLVAAEGQEKWRAGARPGIKNVRWDETLEYWSKSPEKLSDGDADDRALSPGKSRGPRRARVRPEPGSVAFGEPAQEPPRSTHPTASIASTPVASKRRSRIATPAKGLLSRPPLGDEPEPLQAKKPLPTPRPALSAPKRSFTPSGPPPSHRPQPMPTQRTSPMKPMPTQRTSPVKPVGIPVFVPRPAPAGSFEDALRAVATDTRRPPQTDRSPPGLNSPAKRPKRGSVFGPAARPQKEVPVWSSPPKRRGPAAQREDGPPGLGSPAKRRKGMFA